MNEIHRENQNRKIGKMAATARVAVLQPPHLQSVDHLLHLGAAQVQEALDQVPVDEARGLLRFALCVERPPGDTESRETYTPCGHPASVQASIGRGLYRTRPP